MQSRTAGTARYRRWRMAYPATSGGMLLATILAGCTSGPFLPPMADGMVVSQPLVSLGPPAAAKTVANKPVDGMPSIAQAQLKTPLEPAQAQTPQPPTTPANQPAGSGAPTASKITLDDAIRACLLADPKLKSGFEEINQASADALTASLKPNPVMDAGVNLFPLGRPFTPDRTGGPPEFDLNVSYPIDWWLFGKRLAAMASASHAIRVSEAEYANRVRERVTQVAIAYFDVLEAKALRALAAQDVESLGTVESAIRRAVENGGRPQVELHRIRLDLLVSQRNLRDSESAVVGAKARLRALMGRDDADVAFDVEGTLDAPLQARPMAVEEAITLALANRPDLQALRNKIALAQADVDVEDRKAYPDVKPQLGYVRQFQHKALGMPDVSAWGASVEVSLPFFDRNQGNRMKAASVVSQTNFDLQAGVVELRSELEQSVREFDVAYQHAMAVAGDQLRLAGEVRDNVTQAYNAGGRPLLELLDAQKNYRETYRTYVTSRANYWRALYKFNAAIGQQHPNREQPLPGVPVAP